MKYGTIKFNGTGALHGKMLLVTILAWIKDY